MCRILERVLNHVILQLTSLRSTRQQLMYLSFCLDLSFPQRERSHGERHPEPGEGLLEVHQGKRVPRKERVPGPRHVPAEQHPFG